MPRQYCKEQWQGRVDSEDDEALFRWHQKVKIQSNESIPDPIGQKQNIALIGFAVEEGVRRNKGRLGAQKGPDAFRKSFANLPANIENCEVWDFGNIVCEAENLEAAQEEMGELVALLLSKGFFPFAIGGGHEMSWAHFSGLKDSALKKNWGIFNVDAHWDLRTEERATSGTPFKQIADWHKENKRDFSYFCYGVNKAANTESLFNVAEKLGAESIENLELLSPGPKKKKEHTKAIQNFEAKVDSIYLTICLDAFAASLCPGVSAPSPMGLELGPTLENLKTLLKSGKVQCLDIAELNPEVDIDSRTARFTAELFQWLLHTRYLFQGNY